ncbi:MAG TPA: hypothetical protein VMT69_18460 [Kineosporiaceae bacterium]|nr:hypothetical protein [Kineosporiaceae bacterium]
MSSLSPLGVGQPVDSPETPFDAIAEQPWTVSDYTWWLKPALTMLLGVALGAVNLAATEAAGLLRIPALLAALILFAQGPIYWSEHAREKKIKAERVAAARRQQEELRRAQAQADPDDPDMAARIPRLLHHDDDGDVDGGLVSADVKEIDEQVTAQEARLTAGAVAESRGGLLTVLILAIWLGLATLNYSSAPPALLWLSLVAAFLLFMTAWGGLLQRPA